MGFVAPAMMAVGTGLSAMSQIQGGRAADGAGRINQQIKNDQATYVEGRAAAQGAEARRGYEKFRGALRGDLAAYGASDKEGSGLLLAIEAAKLAKLDELNILTEGKNEASALRMGGQMDRAEGAARKRQAVLGGLGTALSGFGQMYQMRNGG